MTNAADPGRQIDREPPLPNPLIPGFNPDPSCVVVEGTYYLVTSTFEYLPGIPVYRSTDFISWEHIGNVATREEQVGIAHAPSGMGVFAPTIRHRDGLFHVIVTVPGSPRGCVVFTASDPAGPWSDGVSIEGIDGIDPDLVWDEQGRAYVTYSGPYIDLRTSVVAAPDLGILQARVDLVAGTRVEEPRSMWSGTGGAAPEGPHLYQRDGWWYLLIAEGGTERNHAVSVARSRSIEDPFEGAPHNPILTAMGTDRPVVSTGHADLVRGPHGNDLIVLLGTRPVGNARSFSPLGRETFVTGVTWLDGWPHVEPVPLSPRTDSLDEHLDFRDPDALSDPGWLAVGRAPAEVGSLAERPGYLTISATSGGIDTFRPQFLGRRQRHITSVCETRVDATDGVGGIGIRCDEYFTVAIVAERAPAGRTRVTARVKLPTLTQVSTAEFAGDEVVLRIETHAPPHKVTTPWAAGGDVIRLSARADAEAETQLAELDGRFWSREICAPFTGRVTGLFAERGTVHFADFRYHGEAGS